MKTYIHHFSCTTDHLLTYHHTSIQGKTWEVVLCLRPFCGRVTKPIRIVKLLQTSPFMKSQPFMKSHRFFRRCDVSRCLVFGGGVIQFFEDRKKHNIKKQLVYICWGLLFQRQKKTLNIHQACDFGNPSELPRLQQTSLGALTAHCQKPGNFPEKKQTTFPSGAVVFGMENLRPPLACTFQVSVRKYRLLRTFGV